MYQMIKEDIEEFNTTCLAVEGKNLSIELRL